MRATRKIFNILDENQYQVNLTCRKIYGGELLDPVDAPLRADNVEEHVDEVKHVHVAEDHGDVGDRVAVQKRN